MPRTSSVISRRWRSRLVGGLGAVALSAAIALTTSMATGAMPKSLREDVMEAVVFLLAIDAKGSRLRPVSSGSGTIIEPNGTILTNYHVIYDFKSGRPHHLVAVGFSKRGSWSKEPSLDCYADPEKAYTDPRMDLALIRCETDMDGRALPKSKRYPFVKIGKSTGIIPGDDVSIIGYPGIGGRTINFTAGKVSGWLGPDGRAGEDWLKTDAIVAGGNSGGAAVDEDGALIGVPTRIGDVEVRDGKTVGQINYLRPVDIASGLISKATSKGWDPRKTPPKSKTAVASSGRDGGRSGGRDRERDPGYGTDDDGDGDSGRRPRRDDGRDEPYVPPTSDGVTVVGRLVAADTGRGVAGGMVLFLKPGVRVRSVTDRSVSDHIFTKAVANSTGRFESERPLPRGASYGVLILARGYKAAKVDDAISAGLKGPERLDVGKVRLARD